MLKTKYQKVLVSFFELEKFSLKNALESLQCLYIIPIPSILC